MNRVDFQVFEALGALVAVLQPDGRIAYWNQACSRLTGFSSDEIRGEPVWKLLSEPQEAESLHASLAKLVRGEQSSQVESRCITVTGERRLVAWTHSTVIGAEGHVEWIVMCGIDVTNLARDRDPAGSDRDPSSRKASDAAQERMGAQEAIRKNERLLNGIFEILPVGVWIADETGCIVRGNPAGQRIWAGARYVGVAEFGEYKAWWADTGEPLAADEWALARALTRGETSIGELIRIQCFDGTFKTIINSALPLYDEQGKFAGAIVVNEDITSLRETEEALRHAVRAHEELLGIVAHDLRNPLNTILLQLEVLSLPGTGAGPRDPSGLERIRSTAMRMNRLIENLLDIVRIDGHALSQKRSPLAVIPLLTEVLEAHQKIVSEAAIALHVETRGALPKVWADRDRLLQVMENLIGNAIKFTRPGGDITVGAAQAGSEVLFSVADSGVGIPSEDLPHLFDRFWQASKADRRGAGLGLAIVKGIVEAHGGRVWAESQIGVGTTFFFTIPVIGAKAATE